HTSPRPPRHKNQHTSACARVRVFSTRGIALLTSLTIGILLVCLGSTEARIVGGIMIFVAVLALIFIRVPAHLKPRTWNATNQTSPNQSMQRTATRCAITFSND